MSPWSSFDWIDRSSGTIPWLRKATADVFESWTAAGTERFSTAGIREEEARELTITFLYALEGAFVLCRASKTTEALEVAGRP
ncbi:MAG: hypothetical protein ACRDLQ_09805 [Solirubrobacterales bacterium]